MQEQQTASLAAESKATKRTSLRKSDKPAKTAESAAPTTKAKAASKPAVKKSEVAKKTEKAAAPEKAVEKAVFTVRLAPKGKPIFALDEISRPRSGRLLLAHTHAALSVLGLMAEARPAVPKGSLLTLIGARAVKYHLSSDNLEDAPDGGIRLTLKGYNTFKTRSVDATAAMAFQAAFLDGKADPSINVSPARLYQTNLG